MKQITTRRTIVSIVTVALFAWQLAGCAVLPERMSGFKEPTLVQQTDINEANKYAQDVNGELLSLHDQYALLEAALIAGALGSGIAFGIATAFNGSKDLLAALGLAGGGLVAIDYASSAPQKIKVINEGRSEILCAMNTAPLLAKVPAPSPAPAAVGANYGANYSAFMATAPAGVAATSSAGPQMLDLAASIKEIRPRVRQNTEFRAESAEAVHAEQSAANTSAAALNVVASQMTSMAIIQNADYNEALSAVYQIVPPTPAQYLAMTASDVAHSVFDLLDESNPSVSDVYNKAKASSPQNNADAQAKVKKALNSTMQAKELVDSANTAVNSQAADLAVPASVSTGTTDTTKQLDQNAQTLTVLSDMVQKAKDCKSMNSGVWNIGSGS